MRFVLYFFTWTFVLATIGSLTAGDLREFGTGAVLSGLMLWWSKRVRDKRRVKLGIIPKNLGKKRTRFGRAFQAAGEAWTSPASNAKPEVIQPIAETAEWVEDPDQSPAETVIDVEPTQTPPTVEGNVAAEEVRHVEPEPTVIDQVASAEPETLAVSDTALIQPEPEALGPTRQIWKDSRGNNLNVGSQVSFLANSRGESVSIAGVLLGERDGKALIEVQKGALLPANEYAIPWNVVSLHS